MSNDQLAMENRQQPGCEELPLNRDVLLGELRQFGSERQILDLDNGSPTNKALLHGQFRYRTVCDGLSMHCGVVTELDNTTKQFELQPGVSMNFLFEGWADFSLLGQTYRMESHEPDIQCTLVAFMKPELITRYFHKGRLVGKFNLYVALEWLQQRCQSPADHDQLAQLFHSHGRVEQFLASQECQRLVRAMMSDCQSGLANQLRIEQQLIALLSAVLDQHLQQLSLRPESVGSHLEPSVSGEQPLRDLLEQAVVQNLELGEIAGQAHLSVSSLQRRVKREFGITVMEFMRQRRLALARNALICDGVSIGEAAHRAGYRHASNFCTAFKRHYSVTPEEMVQAHRRVGSAKA